MKKVLQYLLKLSWLFYSLLLLSVLAVIGLGLINNAPEVKSLEYVEVQAAKATGEGTILGWRELGQVRGINSAAKEHLNVRYDAQDGGWLLQNVASKRKVDAQTSLIDTRYLRRWPLQTGDRLYFNRFTLDVTQADGTHLVLEDKANNIIGTWTGSELLLNGVAGYGACERGGLRNFFGGISDTFKWWIRDFKPQEALRLFSIGGQVHCTTRWPDKTQNIDSEPFPPDSLRIYWHLGKFQLAPGAEAGRVLIERKGTKQDLKYLELPLRSENSGVIQRLILGRTHYLVNATESLLVLKPIANQHVFIEETPDPSDTLAIEAAEEAAKKEDERLRDMQRRGVTPVYTSYEWIGESQQTNPLRSSSILLLLIVAIGGIVFAALMQLANRGRRGASLILRSVLAWSVLLPFWVSHAWGGQLGMMLLVLFVAGTWVTILLFGRGYLFGLSGRLWFMALALGGIGALVLTQLAAGADNTRWIKYTNGHLLTLNAALVAIGLLALFPRQWLVQVWMWLSYSKTKGAKWLRFSFVFIVLALMSFQFAIGTEQGIWGIQPVELAKLMMIFIAAYSLWQLYMLRATHSYAFIRNPKAFILLFVWVLFTFVVVSLILAVGVHDYSPTLIVSAVLAAFIWQAMPHPTQTREQKQRYSTLMRRSAVVILPVGLVIAAGIYFYHFPPGYNDTIPQAERLRIWSDPMRYPEAASQLLNSLARVASGGWWGNGWFGGNASVMTVPAVQDDFIGAFLLNRFGGFFGIVLITVQILWIATLLEISQRLRVRTQSMNVTAAQFILGYILFGLAWVHLLHWLISWGNVLGLLPIMGQPMTWLSAGNSHLLGIGAMTLGLGMLGSWMVSKPR